MLVGNVLEKTDATAAWQLSADKLADWVRSVWQENTKLGLTAWEAGMPEDPAAFAGLREEGFKDLVGLDYIFKWWGGKGDSDALAGQVDVIWKIIESDGVATYRTWIKIAERDFILGLYKEEGAKREKNREAFREAFAQWKELFARKNA